LRSLGLRRTGSGLQDGDDVIRGRQIIGGAAVAVTGQLVGPGGHEKAHDVEVALTGGVVQRREVLLAGVKVGIRPRLQQQLNDVPPS
jgi:hypothetical protein